MPDYESSGSGETGKKEIGASGTFGTTEWENLVGETDLGVDSQGRLRLAEAPVVPEGDKLEHRYDATKLNLSDGDTVAPWTDAEASFDLSAVDTPVYRPNQKNGNAAVEYDGNDDGHFSSFSSNEPLPNWVFAVWRYIDLQGDNNTFLYGGEGTSDRADWFDRDGNKWEVSSGNNTRFGSADTNWHISGVKYDNADGRIRLDGSQLQSGVDLGSRDLGGIALGHRSDGLGFGNVHIGEYLLYTQDVNNPSDIETFLNDKWSVF